MKAFVICGGEGTRLRPYTLKTPKPLLPVGGKPILQFVLENLKANGITEVVLAVGYLKEQIIEYFGDGKKFGMKITYEKEDSPKNTAGSILHYKGKVKEPFVVTMGDHITDIDLRKMIEQHRKSGKIATIALQKHKTKIDYGVAEVEGSEVKRFVEKPVLEHYINTAIYVFEPEIFEYIGERDDFAKNVFPKLIGAGKKIDAYLFEGHWFDIGRVAEYEKIKGIKVPKVEEIAGILKQ